MRSSLSYFIEAARPKTLVASIGPVLCGFAIAYSQSDISIYDPSILGILLLILSCAMSIQVLTNYVNDLWDHKKGSDTSFRKGPRRLISSGCLSEPQMIVAIKWVLTICLTIGLYLSYLGGPLILVMGIVSIIAAFAYTAGPFPLAHNGLGDVFVIIFFGVVPVTGTQWLLVNSITIEAFLIGAAIGLLANLLLIVNNTRDIDEDGITGKKTLVVKLGRQFTEYFFIACLATSFLLIAVVFLRIDRHYSYVLLAFLMGPFSIKTFHLYEHASTSEDFNVVLSYTGKLLLGFSTLVAILLCV